MDAETLLRIGIVVLIIIGVFFRVLQSRGTKHKLKCPKCDSTYLKVLENKTEDIHVETISLPGVGAQTHVRSSVKRACQKCGHIWTQQAST